MKGLTEAQVKVHSKLLEYEPISTFVTESGVTIISLPTRTVEFENLIPENWDQKQLEDSWGHFRFVHRIHKLADGTRVGLWAKSPERVFTADKDILEKGQFWWGGPRATDRYKRVFIPNNSIVEEQLVWEAIFLMELARRNILAELPQALLVYPDGKHQLIVQDVKEVCHYLPQPTPQGLGEKEVVDRVRALGICPEDIGNNLLRNEEGFIIIIDTNRWTWSPYTDNFRTELLKVVKEESIKIAK